MAHIPPSCDCEICSGNTDKPVSMVFAAFGGAQSRWLICPNCTLLLSKIIKQLSMGKGIKIGKFEK